MVLRGGTAMAVPPSAHRGLAIGVATDAAQPDLPAAAGRVAFYVGDDDLTYRLNAEVIATARAAGALGDVLPSLSRLALIEILTGRWTSAEGHLAEINRLGRDVAPRASATSATFGQLAALSAGARVPLGYALVLAAYRGDDRAFEAILSGAGDPRPAARWGRGRHHRMGAGRARAGRRPP